VSAAYRRDEALPVCLAEGRPPRPPPGSAAPPASLLSVVRDFRAGAFTISSFLPDQHARRRRVLRCGHLPRCPGHPAGSARDSAHLALAAAACCRPAAAVRSPQPPPAGLGPAAV